MITGLSPARGGGALRLGCAIIGLRYTFTTGTGVVAVLQGHPQFLLSNFTAGLAVLTFPKSLAYLTGFGEADQDSATPASRQSLIIRAVNRTLGTANVRFSLDGDGTQPNNTAATGEIRLTLFVGE